MARDSPVGQAPVLALTKNVPPLTQQELPKEMVIFSLVVIGFILIVFVGIGYWIVDFVLRTFWVKNDKVEKARPKRRHRNKKSAATKPAATKPVVTKYPSTSFVGKAGYANRNFTINKLKHFPIPKDKRDVQVFTGYVGRMQQMIPNYAEHALPLTDLLKADSPFEWTKQCQASFDKLKKDVQDSQPLQAFDENRLCRVHVRASKLAVASVVLQPDDKGIDRAIEFSGQKLQRYQKNWDMVTKTLFAIQMATRKHIKYLDGHYFEVYTNNGHVAAMFGDYISGIKPLNEMHERWLKEICDLECRLFYLDRVELDN